MPEGLKTGRDAIAFGNICKIAEFHRDIFSQVEFHREIFSQTPPHHHAPPRPSSPHHAPPRPSSPHHALAPHRAPTRPSSPQGLEDALPHPERLKIFLSDRMADLKVTLLPARPTLTSQQVRYERFCVNKPKSEVVVQQYSQYFLSLQVGRSDHLYITTLLNNPTRKLTTLYPTYTTNTILPGLGYAPGSLQGCCAPPPFWQDTDNTKVNRACKSFSIWYGPCVDGRPYADSSELSYATALSYTTKPLVELPA